MTETPAALPTEEIYGKAKKINLELEKLPGHTHVAIVKMLDIMMQHRAVDEQTAHQNAQLKARQDAMAAAEQAAARAREDERIRAEKRIVTDPGLVLAK